MAASVQCRPQSRNLGVVMREVDEDLAVFLGIQNVNMEKIEHLLDEESDQFDDDLNSAKPQPVSLLPSNTSQEETCLIVADDAFIDLEMEMSDHDWLLKQPDSCLLPSLDADVQDSAASQMKISNCEDITLKSELENSCEITVSLSESASPVTTSASVECCTTVSRMPSSSVERKPICRAATPSGLSSLSAKLKPSRASTPTSRATLLPSSKPVAVLARSSTPVRPTPRSLTPSSRNSLPVIAKSGPRSATPTRKPATPPTIPAISASDQSSKKCGSTVLKSSGPSRGTSPMVQSRPSKPSDMFSLSQDAHQTPKVSMPKRPASASRGRVSSHSSSSSEKPMQKSCSPARVRAPISASHKTGSKILSRSRGHNNVGDDVNPVVMGTKMVDRVVNMRKLAPPKQDDYISQENPRKLSQENSGFGRSLSKKSLEMAIRHMDIRLSVPDKSRRSAAAGSVRGTQSGCAKISPAAPPESPHMSNSSSCRSTLILGGAGMAD